MGPTGSPEGWTVSNEEHKAVTRGMNMTSMIRRARLRAAARGVTLIEILIVLAIIGLIAGGVAVVAIPKFQQARIDQAKIDLRTIHPVAEKWRIDHVGEECPTVERLRAERELSTAAKLSDPWDSPYKIFCGDDEVIVSSFGPDRKEGTQDDIRIPEAIAPGK